MTVDAIGISMALSLPPIGLGTSTDDPEECVAADAAAPELNERGAEQIGRVDRGRERRPIDPEDAPW